MDTESERYEYVFRTAQKLISSYLRLKEGELKADTHIVDDAGADSLALVELGFQISETFGVPITDTSGDKLVFKHLVGYIVSQMPAGSPAAGGEEARP
jgi:acyl carrier protein